MVVKVPYNQNDVAISNFVLSFIRNDHVIAVMLQIG